MTSGGCKVKVYKVISPELYKSLMEKLKNDHTSSSSVFTRQSTLTSSTLQAYSSSNSIPTTSTNLYGYENISNQSGGGIGGGIDVHEALNFDEISDLPNSNPNQQRQQQFNHSQNEKVEPLLHLFSIHQKEKAKRLLLFLSNNNVTWSSTGEVKFQERTVTNSNIIDLVSLAISPHKPRKFEIVGLASIIHVVKLLNVPHALLGTPFINMIEGKMEHKNPAWVRFEDIA